MRLVSVAVAAVTALGLTAGETRAQAYPTKQVRIVVPFAAGGAVDALARLVGAKLSESLKQPVVIENRPGAGGNLAADAVAKSTPDGHTILLTTNGHAISPSLYRTLPYDTIKDFIPVTQLISSSLVLVANPKLPATSVPELIAHGKATPGGLTYGSTGVGNPLHLTMEMLKHRAGIQAVAVPYRGDAPLLTALLAGEVPMAITPLATTRPHVEAGKLRALAVTGAARSPALPNVPTVAEQGVAGFNSASWQGFFVPAHTPREIVALIQQETKKALAAPDVLERLKTFGAEPVGSTPEEFENRFRADIAAFAQIVRDARIPQQD
jgi:tripartite-type tricarboxylate transporter receptor subunit TctC